ncbi:MAG: hypothetical protein IVW54_16020 [Candidatus Binataceae bacterium]|nr:hypothetical protein [Candidatus Binataceae bacterium]
MTFRFVTTGMNLCHPITVGLIAKVVGEMDGIGYVGVDVRLNDGTRRKFQPDVAGFRDADGVRENQPVIFVDFESPNSSDGRIPGYHLVQYLNWARERQQETPYVIVTCLPDGRVAESDWELRYTAKGYCNADHKGKLKEICANPFRYWTTVWRRELRGRSDLLGVFFLNIDRRKVVPFHAL